MGTDKIVNQSDWWVDYLEKELSASNREAMDILLEHSETDRVILANLAKVREMVKSTDPIVKFESQVSDIRHFNQLYSRITEKLETVKPLESRGWRQYVRKGIRRIGKKVLNTRGRSRFGETA